jgi:hypothetical protein
VDTVEIVDPTHPLYGKTLPLVGITTTKRILGPAAIVWIDPGVEKAVALSATSLADSPAPPSPCRLSVDSVERLLAVVASLPDTGPEEEHGEDRPDAATGEAPGAARFAPRGERATERRGERYPPAWGVGDIGTEEQDIGGKEMDQGDAGGGL